jgi:hypothetical protein
MPKFHAKASEDGEGVIYWNMEHISLADYSERTGILTVKLVDGFALTLHGQEATDVMEFIQTNRFEPSRDPTPEDIKSFKEMVKSLGVSEWS